MLKRYFNCFVLVVSILIYTEVKSQDTTEPCETPYRQDAVVVQPLEFNFGDIDGREYFIETAINQGYIYEEFRQENSPIPPGTERKVTVPDFIKLIRNPSGMLMIASTHGSNDKTILIEPYRTKKEADKKKKEYIDDPNLNISEFDIRVHSFEMAGGRIAGIWITERGIARHSSGVENRNGILFVGACHSYYLLENWRGYGVMFGYSGVANEKCKLEINRDVYYIFSRMDGRKDKTITGNHHRPSGPASHDIAKLEKNLHKDKEKNLVLVGKENIVLSPMVIDVQMNPNLERSTVGDYFKIKSGTTIEGRFRFDCVMEESGMPYILYVDTPDYIEVQFVQASWSGNGREINITFTATLMEEAPIIPRPFYLYLIGKLAKTEEGGIMLDGNFNPAINGKGPNAHRTVRIDGIEQIPETDDYFKVTFLVERE